MQPNAKRARIYLACGLTGSGKTTYAKKLEHGGAMRFSLDEWMIRLYGEHMSRELFDQRVRSCEALMLELAAKLAEHGIDSVLDLGFWKREAREAAKKTLENVPAEIILLFFDVPEAVLKERLKRRNAERPGHTFEITEEMFSMFQTGFEAPNADENPVRIGEHDEPAPRDGTRSLE